LVIFEKTSSNHILGLKNGEEDEKIFANFRAGGLYTYTFLLHFPRLCSRVFVWFYCVWTFLKPHKSSRNADIPFGVGLQFLQAMIRIRQGSTPKGIPRSFGAVQVIIRSPLGTEQAPNNVRAV
jgi:hypothetical protein